MISIFDLLKIGIGPSSSHTVGPMLAALRFAGELQQHGWADEVARITVELYGSLALTGLGHATDRAVVLGLCGEHPRTVVPESIEPRFSDVVQQERLDWSGQYPIAFHLDRDLLLLRNEFLPEHPNGMRCTARDGSGKVLLSRKYFSVGGGFVVDESESSQAFIRPETSLPSGPSGAASDASSDASPPDNAPSATSLAHATVASSPSPFPYPFNSGAKLLELCQTTGLTIAEIMHANELVLRDEPDIAAGLDEVWYTMVECIRLGCATQGVLPGGLKIRRRAPEIYRQLVRQCDLGPAGTTRSKLAKTDASEHMDWVAMFALAVNEQNAAGGRVVTAPTNGAAGILPAVLAYHHLFYAAHLTTHGQASDWGSSRPDLPPVLHEADDASSRGRFLDAFAAAEPGELPDGNLPVENLRSESLRSATHTFFKTAAAIGTLYKLNASLSAAEMGCQGEVGVACSMAAAGLAALLGGTPQQIENAAEIGMEHNLGLTCDPIAGLVQVPCIERNTMGAIKAINAARLAVLYGDGLHHVPLDQVIETMRQTGIDMQSKYKETSLGGLAVNVTNC